MGRLVRIINGEVAVAHNYVATPEYTLYVADYAGGATPPHGWEYVEDDVEVADYAQPWAQPADSAAAYALGDIVLHNGTRWRSLLAGNVWEPGVSGWRDADADIPAWVQPTGAHDAFIEDAVVQHNGDLWKSLTPANVWEPGVSGWRKMARIPPGETVAPPPAWVQPTGASDDYQIGDRVTHNAQVWVSTAANNVWEPGVYGWVVE